MKAFDFGDLAATRGVVAVADSSERFKKFLTACFIRHTDCDWGDLCEEDKALNVEALTGGDRLFSAYLIPKKFRDLTDEEKIWIITEADRSVTTILFPSEY